MRPMRVVVTGATGNVGTSTVEALSQSPEVEEIDSGRLEMNTAAR